MVVPTAGRPALWAVAVVAARVMFTAKLPARVLLLAAISDSDPDVELDDCANRLATPLGSAAYFASNFVLSNVKLPSLSTEMPASPGLVGLAPGTMAEMALLIAVRSRCTVRSPVSGEAVFDDGSYFDAVSSACTAAFAASTSFCTSAARVAPSRATETVTGVVDVLSTETDTPGITFASV